MLARIGDRLKTSASSKDAERLKQDGQRRNGPQQGGRAEGDLEDTVILSVSAIRALVREEATLETAAPDLLRKLDLLEQHGLQTLPVMPGQSVSDAIRAAASYLLSSS